jgi:hypothetical protein
MNDNSKIINTIPENLEKQSKLTNEQLAKTLEEINKKITLIQTERPSANKKQISKNTKIKEKRGRRSNSSASSSDSDDILGSDFVKKKEPKSYNLIHSNNIRNKVTVEGLKNALGRANDGIELETIFREMNLNFTDFQVPRGNADELIFERLAILGCIPQPRGYVCP